MNKNEYRLEIFWNDIPIGKKNAVTYTTLKMWWNINEREVRRTLHELSSFDNGDNYVLIRSGKNKGFYRTDNEEEIKLYKRECLNKGKSIFAPIRKINRILSANIDQFSINNNLRVIREGLQMKQTEVCRIMQEYDEHFDVPMLSKMENGVCLPTPFQLARLSEIYTCQPTDLIQSEMYY